MTDYILPGPKALSQFRVDNLIKDINSYTNSTSVINELRSCYIHYVNGIAQQLSEQDTKLLEVLLTYDSALDIANDPLAKQLNDAVANNLTSSALGEDTYLIRVVPRPGTISPWSSKATNIAHVCGLQAVSYTHLDVYKRQHQSKCNGHE